MWKEKLSVLFVIRALILALWYVLFNASQKNIINFLYFKHNDIAILTLNEPVKFTYEIQPICLPTSTAQQARSYSGQVATVAGWGSLRENGPQPSILQKVQIPIWTNSECARKYGRAAPAGIIESMICAGQASKDSCSVSLLFFEMFASFHFGFLLSI